jgi:hypothetical protein
MQELLSQTKLAGLVNMEERFRAENTLRSKSIWYNSLNVKNLKVVKVHETTGVPIPYVPKFKVNELVWIKTLDYEGPAKVIDQPEADWCTNETSSQEKICKTTLAFFVGKIPPEPVNISAKSIGVKSKSEPIELSTNSVSGVGAEQTLTEKLSQDIMIEVDNEIFADLMYTNSEKITRYVELNKDEYKTPFYLVKSSLEKFYHVEEVEIQQI